MSELKPPGTLGETLAEISNALVGLHKRFYGKGPAVELFMLEPGEPRVAAEVTLELAEEEAGPQAA